MDSQRAMNYLVLDMDMEFKFGRMVPSIEAIGKITELTARVVSGTLTVTDSRVNSGMISPTVKVLTHVKIARSIKVYGLTMFSMVRVKQSGQMGPVS